MGASWRNLVRATMKTRAWVGRKPLKMKAVIGAAAAAAVLLLLWVFVNDHGFIFFSAELSHAVGISFLIYKLIKDRTCAGLSLKSQELTALFLVLKIYYSYMDFDIHIILDMATLITTLWVIYMIRVTLESSYMEDEDSFSMRYLVIACAFMALLIHPSSSDALINSLILAFGYNLETIAIIPQLRLMQNTKIVESLTAHYVFALGVARFLSCAHWILQVINTRGTILLALGYGLWPGMVILSEIVQTSILSDFCYYYIKRTIGKLFCSFHAYPYQKYFGALPLERFSVHSAEQMSCMSGPCKHLDQGGDGDFYFFCGVFKSFLVDEASILE